MLNLRLIWVVHVTACTGAWSLYVYSTISMYLLNNLLIGDISHKDIVLKPNHFDHDRYLMISDKNAA